MKLVPFNRPHVLESGHRYVREAVENLHLSGDGPFTRRCHELLQDLLGAPKVLLTTSCTHALEMAAILLDLGPGDEVILPSFTFVSTANAFVLRGAKPIFADVRPDTLNLDETQLDSLITSRTRAIVPVHYGGVGCEMDAIAAIAERHGLAVIEDNAHGFMGKYRGRMLGGFGKLATLSFHETKNFTCGEGGALILNDAALIERAEIVREKGTDRSRFFRGEVDKYTWVDVGSSYLPSEVLAALLFSQLEAAAHIQAHRLKVHNAYSHALRGWAHAHGVRLPIVPEHCEHPAHLFYLLLPSAEHRQGLIAHLKARGVNAVFHYLPLHLSEMGRRFGGVEGTCPVTERVSEQLLRLPLFNQLTEADVGRVIEGVLSYRGEVQRVEPWRRREAA